MKTIAETEALLLQTMEGEVIRSLLSGNDTQCFTTLQYVRARDKWIERFVGCSRAECGIDETEDELIPGARKQLKAIGLVVEVRPDVWARPSA